MTETQITIKSSKPNTQRILRTLSDQESFYFYRAVGEPIGERATSLADFQTKIPTVDPLSIAFHFYRGDFARWIKNVIGDSALASELTVRERTTLKGEELRSFIAEKIKTRLSQHQATL